MLAGIAIGYVLRGRNFNITSKILSLTIIALLFFLGVAVGSNPKIMDNLGTIGIDALIITLAALAGTYLLAWFVYRKFFRHTKPTDNEGGEE